MKLRLALWVVISALIAVPALAQVESLVAAPGGNYAVRVTSLRDLRTQEIFRTTIRQQFDFSCGSAALATLLTHHYRRPVDEQTAFRAMFEHGDQEKIQREGFSMRDMKRYLEALGYESDGFEATLDELKDANIPAIALVQENGYNHFVVVKGVYKDRVLLGDPAIGTREVTRDAFTGMWTLKIFFVIRSHQEHAKFNEPAHWKFRQRAPVDAATLGDGTATAVLMRPGRNEF